MKNLGIQIYADTASIDEISHFNSIDFVKGFTTNPTLISKNGAKDYIEYCKRIYDAINQKPVSFEVIADDHLDMMRQANELQNIGPNVFVKIPITNTLGVSSLNLIKELCRKKININITAIFTNEQISSLVDVLDSSENQVILSIFAGRIANAGHDPELYIKYCANKFLKYKNIQTLWASSREVFNIIQAERSKADIITLTPDLIKSAQRDLGKSLDEYSLETVKMFYNDAIKSGYKF